LVPTQGSAAECAGGAVGDTYTVDDIERFRRDLLAREDLSTRTAQKVITLCAGVFNYDALGEAGLDHLRLDIDRHGEPQKPIVFHDLRHSFCSWAVDVWPVPDVKEFAGHRDIATTMKYVHRTAKTTHATMADEALTKMLGGAAIAA
jgi:integrase